MPILFNSKTGTNAWLSNFWEEKFIVPSKLGNIEFLTSEGAYQFAKLPEDQRTMSMALMYSRMSGNEAKQAGKRLPLREDWEGSKLGTMQFILRWKFAPGTRLLAELMKTGDQELIHYCPWGDTYWGVDRHMQGSNMLGKLLMARRQEVRNIQQSGTVSR